MGCSCRAAYHKRVDGVRGFLIAEQLFPSAKQTALYAGLLYSLEPLSILYTWHVVPETLFTFLVCAGVYFFIAHIKTRSLARLIGAACLIAVSVYVKVTSYYLALCLATGSLCWMMGKNRLSMSRIKHLVLFLGIVIFSVGGWQVRNQVKTGFSGFSAIAAYNLYYFEGASLLAKQEHVPVYMMQKRMAESLPEGSNQAAYYRVLYREGIGLLRAHPVAYAAIYARGFLMTFFEPVAVDFSKFLGWYPAKGGLLGVVFDKGVYDGLMQLGKKSPGILWGRVFLEAVLLFCFFLSLVALVRIPWRSDQALFVF